MEEIYEEELNIGKKLGGEHPWLYNLPFINSMDPIDQVIEGFKNYRMDFTWAVKFDEDFLGKLMYHGFLTMCERLEEGKYVLMPKLHRVRCVLDVDDLHIGKGTRKKSGNFELTIDKEFKKVCDLIVEQHGPNWFHVPLVETFVKMNKRKKLGCFNGKVFIHSVELWEDENLVAGEIGYICGGCYTSLSGFSKVDSSGSVQMAALGSLLNEYGIKMWDLGMSLPYKLSMGAKNIPRLKFLAQLREAREKKINFLELSEPLNGKDAIVKFLQSQRTLKAKESTNTTTTNPEQISKKQQKRLAKLKRIEEKKKAKKLAINSDEKNNNTGIQESVVPPVRPIDSKTDSIGQMETAQ